MFSLTLCPANNCGTRSAQREWAYPLPSRPSISSITRFIFCIVRFSGSSVVISTPASFSRSIGYFDPPELMNAR